MIKKIICISLVLGFAAISRAQLVDNTSAFRRIDRSLYFRLHYDNDYFTKSDEYYSQGITFEYVSPGIRKFPLTKLLWTPYKTAAQFGVTFNLVGYTPTRINSDTILRGDRPYDAGISVKTFAIQTDTTRHQMVSTSLILGVMGPAALGKEIQTNIHRWLKDPMPHGWQYQIQNDIIINYQLNYEKQLLAAADYFLLNTTAEARLGTLNDKLSGGFNFMAGRFNRRFMVGSDKARKVEYYLYGQARAHLVGYDASLQGGLLNDKSPYVIRAADISRWLFQADAGVIVNLKWLYLSYTQSFLTREFRSGKYHRWGGISIGFPL